MKTINTFKILAVCSIALLASCKKDASKKEVTDSGTKEIPSKDQLIDSMAKEGFANITEGVSPEKIKAWNIEANNILKFRKEAVNETFAALETGVWEYEFVFEKGAMSKAGEKQGQWLDFDNKFGYQYGLYDKKEGSGKYHYDYKTGLVLMVDEDATIKPKEYKAMLNGDMLVLVGQATYLDNAYQAKLKNAAQAPKK